MTLPQFQLFLTNYTKQVLRIVKPWKKTDDGTSDGGELYCRGWNDCVKEMTLKSKDIIKLNSQFNSEWWG